SFGIAVLLLLAVSPVAGQTHVAGLRQVQLTMMAQLRIPEMLLLGAEQGNTQAVRAGAYSQVDGAVTLYVSANRSWRLVAEPASRADVQVRASTSSERVHGAAGEFESAAAPIEVAEGSNVSRAPIRMDYRWISASTS